MKHILASTTHGFKVQTSQMLDFYAIFQNSQDLAQNNLGWTIPTQLQTNSNT